MKHRLALLHLILLFLLLMAKVSAQSAYVADSLYADSLKQITRHYLEAQRWDSVVKYGSLLFEEAYQQHDWHGNIIEAHVALQAGPSEQQGPEAQMGRAHPPSPAAPSEAPRPPCLPPAFPGTKETLLPSEAWPPSSCQGGWGEEKLGRISQKIRAPRG